MTRRHGRTADERGVNDSDWQTDDAIAAAACVTVMTGTDSVIDHWPPFGTGSMLEKANLYAQLYRGSDEFVLSRALHITTGGILPLANSGERQCPQLQDEASMMLVDASCSAEAVARIAPVRATPVFSV